MRSSYYDVLGVAPNASDGELRARYRRLIRRYHPDHNQSPLAHDRATAINEAFHFLSDPELRAQHDAELATQRRDAMNARSLALVRNGGRGLVVRRARRPLVQRYGARLAVLGLVVGTCFAGWRIERSLVGEGDVVALPSVKDDDEAQRAVQALTAATLREAQDMPPVDDETIGRGVTAYRRFAASGDLRPARAFSEHCHVQAANADDMNLLDFCVAFDQAAFIGLARSTSPAVDDVGYFVDGHDRAAHLYVSRVYSLDAIERRLGQIRARVARLQAPPADNVASRTLHRLSKRGWKLAGAVWHLGDTPNEHADGEGRASDF